MKVKNFVYESYHASIFEKELNEFIKDKKVIDIKYSTNGGAHGALVISGLVMYEEE